MASTNSQDHGRAPTHAERLLKRIHAMEKQHRAEMDALAVELEKRLRTEVEKREKLEAQVRELKEAGPFRR